MNPEDIARATEAVANTTGKAIDASRELGGFFNKVLGDAATQLGQTLHDWTRFFRYRNLLKLRDKVEAIHAERQVLGKTIPIPPKYAIPLIDRASLEENGELQDLWAALIANATDPERRLELKRVFSDALASLEPLDARVLSFLSTQGWAIFRDIRGTSITVRRISCEVGATEAELRISLQNLHRLGLIVDEYVVRDGLVLSSPDHPEFGTTSFGTTVAKPSTSFRLSPLGYDLVRACQRENVAN